MNEVIAPLNCQVCKRECQLLRCTRCRSAWYCSIICQRNDWKHHRIICNKSLQSLTNNNVTNLPSISAEQALNELSTILSSASQSNLAQGYHIAHDMVKTLGKESDTSTNIAKRNSVANLKEQKPMINTNKSFNVAPKSSGNIESILDRTHDISNSGDSIVDSENISKMNHSFNDADTLTSLLKNKSQEISMVQKKIVNLIDEKVNEYWMIYAEDMTRLFCYQILLRPQKKQTINLDLFKTYIRQSPSALHKTFILLKYESFQGDDASICIEVDRQIIPSSCRVYLVDQDEAMSIRISYSPDDEYQNQIEPLKLLNPNQIQTLGCKYCNNQLFAKKQKLQSDEHVIDVGTEIFVIDRVLQLPSGRWDDMDDFLICYSGQPVVNFDASSTAGQRRTLLEDETVFVTHSLDVAESVCVVAIPGYGEEPEITEETNDIRSKSNGDLDNVSSPNVKMSKISILESLGIDKDPSALIRGSRSWREAVGGATLTCSLCASILGFAPTSFPYTYRFLKHNVVVLPSKSNYISKSTEQLKLKDFSLQPKALTSVAEFIAHEMIRYAESKAIFSFAITMKNSSDHQKLHTKCLFLRLLSWDSVASHGSRVIGMDKNTYNFSEWSNMAKIVYEESYNLSSEIKSENNSVLWMWATTDLCCPMNETSLDSIKKIETEKEELQENEVSTSIVRLCLSHTEWHELHSELKRSSHLFSQDVIHATILAKTGRSITSNEKLGLSGISLKYFK